MAPIETRRNMTFNLDKPLRGDQGDYFDASLLQEQLLKLNRLNSQRAIMFPKKRKCDNVNDDPLEVDENLPEKIRFLARAYGVSANEARSRSDSLVNGEEQQAAFHIVGANQLRLYSRISPKYVAVSYCWPRTRDKERALEEAREERYVVRDGDKKRSKKGWRKSRARVPVIDRAFAYAAEKHIKYVWIDQECIEQGDRDDKEHGIKSMASIYEQATYVVGLLQTTLHSHHEAEAFRQLTPDKELGVKYLQAAMQVVRRISNDAWFTRAWTFQEATSGAKTIELSIRCPPEWRGDDVDGDWGAVKDEIQFDFAHISGWFEILKQSINRMDEKVDDPSADVLSRSEIDILKDELRIIKESPMCRFPQILKIRGERHRYNAAMALKLLENRANSRCPDRVAIMANLGDYPVRLSTKDIDDFSMADCVLIQSLWNGDLSLLAGVERQVWQNMPSSNTRFNWLPPDDTVLIKLHAYDEGHQGLRFSSLKLSDRGLSIQGHHWLINKAFDVHNIQSRYCEQWQALSLEEKQELSVFTLENVAEPLDRLEDDEGCGFHDGPGTNSSPLAYADDTHTTALQGLASKVLWDLIQTLVQDGRPDVANALWYSYRRKTPSQTAKERKEQLEKRREKVEHLQENIRDQTNDDQQSFDEPPKSPWFKRHHSMGPRRQMPGELPATLDDYITTDSHGHATVTVPCLSDPKNLARVFVPVEHNYQWLIDRIMARGELMLGMSRAYVDPWAWVGNKMKTNGIMSISPVNSIPQIRAMRRAVCIFDVDGPCDIITPHCDSMEDMFNVGLLRMNTLPPLRSKRISWIIQRHVAPDEKAFGFPRESLREKHAAHSPRVPYDPQIQARWKRVAALATRATTFRTKGMVSGAWRLESINPREITLI